MLLLPIEVRRRFISSCRRGIDYLRRPRAMLRCDHGKGRLLWSTVNGGAAMRWRVFAKGGGEEDGRRAVPGKDVLQVGGLILKPGRLVAVKVG